MAFPLVAVALWVLVGTGGIALAQEVPPLVDEESRPVMTADPEGSIHIVWVEGELGTYDLLYSTGNGSSWTEAETVATGTSVFDLALLIRPDGVPCVVWSTLQLLESCREGGVWPEAEVVAERSYAASYRPAYSTAGELEVLYLEPTSSVFFDGQLLNQADQVVTFPEFVIDINGGFHGFWWDFTDDRGWLWAHSTDGGASWTAPLSLATDLPLAGGTLVGVDERGGVHSVLLGSDSVIHRQWTAASGWSEPDHLEFEIGVSAGDMVVAADGGVTVVGASRTNGVRTLVRPPGGPWRDEGLAPGTEGRTIDYVALAAGAGGRGVVLWHETGAVGFNLGRVGGESLVAAVPSIGDLNLEPLVIATTLALTAGMVVAIPFPAELFNNTLAAHHGEIRLWGRRRDKGSKRWWDSAGGVATFLVAAALLFGFLDPAFGINPGSLPVFIGLLVGVVITTLGFALPTMVQRRLRVGEWGRLRALPLALLVGAGCVLLSRAIGFLPGYLYGVVLGLAFSKEVSADQEASEARTAALVVVAISLISWVGLGVWRGGGGEGWAGTVIEAALATVVVAGFEALVIGLLPLAGMPGKPLFARFKTWWIAIWGISLVVFFHALVNPQSGYLADSALVPVATTMGLLLGFALLSVGFWGFFALRDRRRRESPPSP